MRTRSLGLWLSLLAGLCINGAARGQTPEPATLREVSARLERLAAETTHFATHDIIANRESERRWPANLVAEQRRLVSELHTIVNERESLNALVAHQDPRIRTLVLGALFMREDPRDLPAIARLMNDGAATFPLLQRSLNSTPAAMLPLAEFESAQTVGKVASAMITYYLDAAFHESTFDQYWSERGTWQRTAGWFLARIRRASRQTTPFQPQYRADIGGVLTQIDALSPAERGWTLLYTATGILHDRETPLVPDETLVTALKAIEPEALLKFLRGEPPTDDPDLRPDGGPGRRDHAFQMCQFILAHAPSLFEASDADAVLAAATAYSDRDDATIWLAAAARLRGLDDIETAAAAQAAPAPAESRAIERASRPVRAELNIKVPGRAAMVLWSVQVDSSRVQINFENVPDPSCDYRNAPEERRRQEEAKLKALRDRQIAGTQIWLLKADGGVIPPLTGPSSMAVSMVCMQTPSAIYTFPPEARTQAVALVFRSDDDWFIDRLPLLDLR